MRYSALIFVAVLAIQPVRAIQFEGQKKEVLSAFVSNTGLDNIYVAYSTGGLTMVYNAQSASSAVKWYRFSSLGGAYAEEVVPTRSGSRVTLSADQGDMGYIIEEGSERHCYWLIDYSKHLLVMRSLAIAPEQGCDAAVLAFDGDAEGLPYYTITGRRMLLSRDMELRYRNAIFSTETFSFTEFDDSETYASVGQILSQPGVYITTQFELCGDAFLRRWGEEMCVESPTYMPYGVAAYTRATQTEREVDNEQGDDNVDGLGGSAPCEITFEAAVSEATAFTEWQISRSPDFATVDNTYSELSFTYTFTDQGTTYVRFVANNADGTCEYIGDTYEVFIGESKLLIPNAFSPDASPGVNDEWKVSYKSLVSYECHIFNRWGTQMFSSTDPAEGWDGKYRGKYVPAGVYFYVIKARGADGIDYDKSGDINIIKYKQGTTTSSGESAE